MRITRTSAVGAVAIVGALALSACGSDNTSTGGSGSGSSAGSTAAANADCFSGQLNAEGSTAQKNAIEQAIKSFQTACGDATINASCDGRLAVHREGCLVVELKGHTLPKGAATAVLGLEAVDAQHLVSLGADGTLRLWDVESLSEVRSVQPEVEAPTWLTLDADAAIVLVTSADGTSLQSFSTELEAAQTLTDLPASTGGWKAVGKAKAVAVADGANAIVTVDLADSSVSEHKFQMTPLTVEALADSTLAVGMPARLTLVEPGDEEVVVRDGVRYGHAVGFSADGAATHLADGVGGVASFDTRSGALIRRFDEPGRIQ